MPRTEFAGKIWLILKITYPQLSSFYERMCTKHLYLIYLTCTVFTAMASHKELWELHFGDVLGIFC